MDGEFCDGITDKVVQQEQTAPKIVYKNNLEVNNWYYGTSNQSKYEAYLTKKSDNTTLTACPSKKPFVRDD